MIKMRLKGLEDLLVRILPSFLMGRLQVKRLTDVILSRLGELPPNVLVGIGIPGALECFRISFQVDEAWAIVLFFVVGIILGTSSFFSLLLEFMHNKIPRGGESL